MASGSDAAAASHHHPPVTSPPDPAPAPFEYEPSVKVEEQPKVKDDVVESAEATDIAEILEGKQEPEGEVKEADSLPVGISNEEEKLEFTAQVEEKQKAETDFIAASDPVPESAGEVKEAEEQLSKETIEEQEVLEPPSQVEAEPEVEADATKPIDVLESTENTEDTKEVLEELSPPSQVPEESKFEEIPEATGKTEAEELLVENIGSGEVKAIETTSLAGITEEKELVPPAEIEEELKEEDATSAIAASEEAAAEATEQAKETIEATAAEEAEQEVLKETENSQTSPEDEQEQGERKGVADGVQKETGTLAESAEEVAKEIQEPLVSQKPYEEVASIEEETREDQVAEPHPETPVQTVPEEISEAVSEGEQVKDIVKEAVVETGKDVREAKNDKTQEQEIENASPTDGSAVQQEQEKVKTEDTLILTEEVADTTLDGDTTSRDLEFAPESNQRELSEPAAGEKDAVAEEHKESETHEESLEEHHEESQSKHKHSHNILSKVKQSLVKAKKAILGKHPKTTSSET